jgi:hypothetical protein
MDGAVADAHSIETTIDGGTSDSSTSSTDAGQRVDASDSGQTCIDGYELIDRSPIMVSGQRATLSSDGDQFWLAYWHTNFAACDSACWGVLELGRAGAPSDVQPAYWMSESFTSPDARLETHAISGRVMFVARVGTRAIWQTRPLRVENWEAEGTYSPPEGREIADIALSADGSSVFVATYTPDDDLRYRNLALERRSMDGTSLLGSESITGFLRDFGVRDVNIVATTPGDPPWITAIQDFDFPPSVQVARAGEVSFRASSCGVQTYHAVNAFDQLAVVQDCGDRTELETRTGTETRIMIREGRAPVPSRVAVNGANIMVAHVVPGATTPSLTIVHRIEPGALELVGTIPLPPTVEPASSIDISALDDGTIAVAWSLVPSDPSPWAGDTAIVRLRPCTTR